MIKILIFDFLLYSMPILLWPIEIPSCHHMIKDKMFLNFKVGLFFFCYDLLGACTTATKRNLKRVVSIIYVQDNSRRQEVVGLIVGGWYRHMENMITLINEHNRMWLMLVRTEKMLFNTDSFITFKSIFKQKTYFKY